MAVVVGAYPRSRGGTYSSLLMKNPEPGLSPLTRGNHLRLRDDAREAGPIPAHAGEPQRTEGTVAAITAYPRSRGGTTSSHLEV